MWDRTYNYNVIVIDFKKKFQNYARNAMIYKDRKTVLLEENFTKPLILKQELRNIRVDQIYNVNSTRDNVDIENWMQQVEYLARDY